MFFECEFLFLLLFCFGLFLSLCQWHPAENNVLYYGFQMRFQTVVAVPEGNDSINHAVCICDDVNVSGHNNPNCCPVFNCEV